MFQDWAFDDFDLFKFVGQDEAFDLCGGGVGATPGSDQAGGSVGSSGNAGDYQNGKDDEPSLQKRDYMYSTLQYNEIAAGGPDSGPMYGGMNGSSSLNGEQLGSNGYMRDDRFNQNANIPTTSAQRLPQGQQQPQPSTSRMTQQQHYNDIRILNSRAQLPSSSTSPPNGPNGMYLPAVKQEPGYDMYDGTSDTESHYSNATNASKPRKYRIKPECERRNPQYRMKRAKNNDAVRRSRDKAKRMQQEKEQRLVFLEKEHGDHFKIVNSLQKRVSELEKEILRMRNQCSCGSTSQNFMRR